jgi:hypothetical protein
MLMVTTERANIEKASVREIFEFDKKIYLQKKNPFTGLRG